MKSSFLQNQLNNLLLRERKNLRLFVLNSAIFALSTVAILSFSTSDAFAQQVQLGQSATQVSSDAQLLLNANELVYDNDAEKVIAKGDVQLDYDGYKVVADRVAYNQKTNRVTAFGNVEIVEPDGNIISAQEIDLDSNFSTGFVNALRVETPDNTRFAAESAERFAGQKTVFHHGVYTACEPCKKKPNKAPIWQVKAQKVILDGVEKTVSYRHARFEFFGLPIAYLPYFSHADPSVKRKTGFLVPNIGYNTILGAWIRQPYFLATGDSHDLTIKGTYFTRQGVLGEAQWRHQLENGSYSIKIAGIDQQNPSEFTTSPDNDNDFRGMIGTKGRFHINPRWAFGWNILAQTDSNFSKTYSIDGFSDSNVTNEVYLEGLHNRSFFNLSAKQYLVQNSTLLGNGTAFQFESEQPTVHPVLDYNYVTTEGFTGGELNLDVNVTSLSRNTLSKITPTSGDVRTHGINGDTTRVSADLSWKKTLNTDSGLLITPSLSLRGDWLNTSGETATGQSVDVENGSYARFMPTAGLQVSYPVLFQAAQSSHVLEPIAQIFARPDLGFDGVAPNEDAQSLVFDATTLFQRDKFSGYDKIESGTRANIGLRYSAQFDNGLSLNALVGQSFHLAGDNPYAREDDLVNAGEESGLEEDSSDIVAAFSAIGNSGLLFNTQARFDKDNFEVRRAGADLSYSFSDLSFSTNYTFIDAQPDYGNDEKREQVGFSARYKFKEHWSVFGGAQYDLRSEVLVSNNVGILYSDECFTFSLSFSETRSRTDETNKNQAIGFKIGFRTIGEYGSSVNTDQFEN